MEYRWQVVVVVDGRVVHVQRFRKLNPAKVLADRVADEMQGDSGDVAIWDHALNKVIYSPMTGKDLYGLAQNN